tara:strand:- start:1929 stop:3971 length:2043 start_codon:yes stop_codon:yes gene_type:complete
MADLYGEKRARAAASGGVLSTGIDPRYRKTKDPERELKRATLLYEEREKAKIRTKKEEEKKRAQIAMQRRAEAINRGMTPAEAFKLAEEEEKKDLAAAAPADAAPAETDEVASSPFADAAGQERELTLYEETRQTLDDLKSQIEQSSGRQKKVLEGYAEKLEAQANQVAAVQQEEAERADRRTRALELMNQRHDEAVARANDEIRNAERMVTSHEIDPNRAFKTTGARVASAIAIAMSALGQGLSGRTGPNTAYKIINDAINRDIDLQKEELRTRKDVLRNKNNLYANMMSRFGHERSAEIATHQAGLAAAKQKVLALQAAHKGQNAQAAVSEVLGKIEADQISNTEKLGKIQGSLALQESRAARTGRGASGNEGTIASALAKLDLLPETFKKVGKIEGAIATTLSGFGLGGLISMIPGIRDADFYEDARNLIAKEITRAFDGGRPTDKDFAILLARLPPAGMEKEGGLRKIQNLRDFLIAEAGPGGRFKRGQLEAKYGESITAEQLAIGKQVEALAGKEDWEFFTPEGGKKKRPRIVKHEGRPSGQDIVSPLGAGFDISSHYGMRDHPITGGRKMHKGTDFAAPKNTPVLSMLDGTVTYAGNQGGKTGYVVKIKDESGRETKFFHLNPGSLKVKKGQKVKAGQHVAGVGNTGGSTGYHLHAELLIGGKHVDLADYLGGA